MKNKKCEEFWFDLLRDPEEGEYKIIYAQTKEIIGYFTIIDGVIAKLELDETNIVIIKKLLTKIKNDFKIKDISITQV